MLEWLHFILGGCVGEVLVIIIVIIIITLITIINNAEITVTMSE